MPVEEMMKKVGRTNQSEGLISAPQSAVGVSEAGDFPYAVLGIDSKGISFSISLGKDKTPVKGRNPFKAMGVEKALRDVADKLKSYRVSSKNVEVMSLTSASRRSSKWISTMQRSEAVGESSSYKAARKRWYVGRKGNTSTPFQSAEEPTKKSHGSLYGAVVGPFNTGGAARLMAKYGRNNPHLQTVADAERMFKLPEYKKEFGRKKSGN